MRNKMLLLGPLAAFLATIPNASASLQLTLQSGAGAPTVVNDNGAGDANGAIGQITFIGAVGNWLLNVTTGTVGNNPLIDLSSNDAVTGNGVGVNSLKLKFSGTDFGGPQAGFDVTIGGTLAKGTTLQFQSYVDGNNVLNAETTPIGPLLTFGPDGSFSGEVFGGSAGDGLFSLTEDVNLSATKNGLSSFDAAVDVVPEPASVVLLGGVLLATVSAIRRKVARRRV